MESGSSYAETVELNGSEDVLMLGSAVGPD